MDKHDVNISIPNQAENSDVIVITGAPQNVEAAEITLLERVKELDGEQEDRVRMGRGDVVNSRTGRWGKNGTHGEDGVGGGRVRKGEREREGIGRRGRLDEKGR